MANSLVNRLFEPAKDTSSFRYVLAWWELRRIPYNVLVGTVGFVSFGVNLWLWTTYIQKPGEDDGFGPLVPVIVFGILANFFYTIGWVVEGSLLALQRRGSETIGPRLYKLGLAFSLVLAALPALVLAIEVLFRSQKSF